MKSIISKMLFFALMLTAVYSLSSCQSKEEQVISGMEKILKTVSADDFNLDDMDKIEKQYDEILETSKECNFNDDQVKKIAELQGRITAEFAKQGAKKAGSILKGAAEAAGDFVKGLGDAISDDSED